MLKKTVAVLLMLSIVLSSCGKDNKGNNLTRISEAEDSPSSPPAPTSTRTKTAELYTPAQVGDEPASKKSEFISPTTTQTASKSPGDPGDLETKPKWYDHLFHYSCLGAMGVGCASMIGTGLVNKNLTTTLVGLAFLGAVVGIGFKVATEGVGSSNRWGDSNVDDDWFWRDTPWD
ncbi:MAG: hypothetical protein LE180_02090 [Endomicrobium sp.]|uniref:hypothetical protein n=1 Tax=Candidatus Endomicrobiellum pyrsonymphae TaxID=1408203 RepID=UPI003572ED57|nr:hypothetical protein [Endomicrobium sp.]